MDAPSFFQSTAFAIPALVLVGGSWCATGYVMGKCPKCNVPAQHVQVMGAIVSSLLSLVIMVMTQDYPTASKYVTTIVCADYFICGVMDFHLMMLMSKAMQRGPNGIVWAVIQSALIFAFLGGVFMFDMKANGVQWAGIFSIICALMLFAMMKDNSVNVTRRPGEWSWKALSFCAMAIVGLQQNLVTAPSYYPETAGVPSILRTLVLSLGTLVGFFTIRTSAQAEGDISLKLCLKNSVFWKFIIILQFFSLAGKYLLLFPGIDVMARHGLGGVAYPLMVGSCIVSFTIFSSIVLKERFKFLEILALILCVAGLFGICMQNAAF